MTRFTPIILVACVAIHLGCSTSRTKRTASQKPASSLAEPARSASDASLHTYWGPLPTRAALAARTIAWEAENPQSTDFPETNPFAPRTPDEAAKLSGGQWIGVDQSAHGHFLDYEIKLPKAGVFQLFARKFWKHGPFRWRFDGGPYSTCGKDPMLLDGVGLRKHVGAHWVSLGEVELATGRHRFRVELLDPASPAAFDKFLLVEGDDIPHGLGIADPEAPAPAGWFAVAPSALGAEPSMLDLRFLNEPNRSKFERLIARDGRIVRASSGVPERLFGVNVGPDILSLPDSMMRRHTQWLAQLGVNLVRLHGPLFRQSDFSQLDPDKLDNLLRFHSALKRAGIYLGLSIYFPTWIQLKDDPRFPGYTGQSPFGLAFFQQQFSSILARWWEELLSIAPGPNGTRLADDPSLAYVELVNEDSTLFWTMSSYTNIPERETEELERQFGRVLTQKYGSIGQAFKAWRTPKLRGDSAEAGRAGLMGLYDIAHVRDLRARDTAEFLARLMREFYLAQTSALREKVGYRGLTVCSNWRTADARYLDPLDKWANSVCDLMDHHGYYQGPHRGEAATYSVEVGQQFDDRSSLRFDSSESDTLQQNEQVPPIAGIRIAGKPSIVSEIGWPSPNRYRAEYAALVVGYGSLLGVDGVALFANTHPRWSPTLDKFSINDAAILGQSPAAAFTFRQGLVAEGQTQVDVNLPEKDLFALVGLPLAAPQTYDGLRLKDLPFSRLLSSHESDEMDPLAYLVGPVELGFVGKRHSTAARLHSFIDRDQRTVTSNTGELRLDYGRGLLTIDAQGVHAVAGFLRESGRIALGAADFSLNVDYGSVFLVALDGRTLVDSRRMLLQVVTEASNSGFDAPGAGLRVIKNTGHAPVIMRNVAGTVWLKRPDAHALAVVALDSSGRALRRSDRGANEIPLLPDVNYYVIESRAN